MRKSIITKAKKLPTSVFYGTQILYFNPMLFWLEHLSLVENTVKHNHFQDHIQETNGLQQSYIIYLCFFFLADLNSLDNICSSARATYFSLHKKLSFPLRISSVNMTKSTGNCGFGHTIEEILSGKLHFLRNVCLLKSMVKNLLKFNTTAVKPSFI